MPGRSLEPWQVKAEAEAGRLAEDEDLPRRRAVHATHVGDPGVGDPATHRDRLGVDHGLEADHALEVDVVVWP
jgi:hypothetical protein